jgi:CubicO group peptidase (beta-lactamase class C family)
MDELTCRDQARLGWLWRHAGRWRDRQVIPAAWMRQATVTAALVRATASPEGWCYGHGFWTNDRGTLWPSLPRDSFAAQGAGGQHIWVCPSLDLVVAQSPGIWADQRENDHGVIRWIVDALRA